MYENVIRLKKKKRRIWILDKYLIHIDISIITEVGLWVGASVRTGRHPTMRGQ